MPPKQPIYKATIIKLADPANPATRHADVLQRIIKSRQKGNHANTPEQEAQTALLRAKRLMEKHNIEEADVIAMESPEKQQERAGHSIVAIRRTDGKDGGLVRHENHVDPVLIDAILMAFDCEVYQSFIHSPDYLTGTNKQTGINHIFFGIAINTIAAAKAFELVYNLIADSAQNANSRKDYCEGFTHGLFSRIQEEIHREEEEARQAKEEARKAAEAAREAKLASPDYANEIRDAEAKLLSLKEKLTQREAERNLEAANDLKVHAIPLVQEHLDRLKSKSAAALAATAKVSTTTSSHTPPLSGSQSRPPDNASHCDRRNDDHSRSIHNSRSSRKTRNKNARYMEDTDDDDEQIDIGARIKVEPDSNETPPEHGIIVRWKSLEQLKLYRENAKKIADEYFETLGVKLVAGRKYKVHTVKDQGSFDKGLEDGKNTDVGRKRKMADDDDEDGEQEAVVGLKRITM